MKEKNNKTKCFILRLTEEEYTLLTIKSKLYPSKSSFILDAVKKFDDRLGIQQMDCMEEWAEHCIKWKNEINSIGVNINQFAKYANILKNQGLVNEELIEEYNKELKLLRTKLHNIEKIEKKIAKKVSC